MNTDPQRSEARRRFLAHALGNDRFTLAPASADASFRSYWRATLADGSTRVLMDAPPGQEDLAPWLDIGARLRRAGLHVPCVDAVDPAQGFVLMEDLGRRDFLGALDDSSVDALYGDALDALLRMQTHVDTGGLPRFDATFARQELELMPRWFLREHLGHAPDADEAAVVTRSFECLIEAVQAQPLAFMHRDYHSRNLMLCSERHGSDAGVLANPGIIDFQGAMSGPISYDLASLLRDCYIHWTAEQIEGWLEAHRQRLLQAHLLDSHTDAARFRRWFDLTGLQRHLKVLGIFCRLHYRDGKSQYLGDLPRVWRYVLEVARAHHELAALADLLERALGNRDITRPRTEAAP